MLRNGDLTYWEYWLTKEVWHARDAIQLIADYIKFSRGWDRCDECREVNNRVSADIESKMNDDLVKDIFRKRTHEVAKYDEADNWLEGKVILDDSDVYPLKYLEWVHSKGYPMPYEFKVFIGVEEKETVLTPKAEEMVDRMVCQGIGRTLWDLYPDMTIEEMQFHKAIQVYGGGKGYPGEGTLRRWLRAVDRRKVKTGPKKKI